MEDDGCVILRLVDLCVGKCDMGFGSRDLDSREDCGMSNDGIYYLRVRAEGDSGGSDDDNYYVRVRTFGDRGGVMITFTTSGYGLAVIVGGVMMEQLGGVAFLMVGGGVAAVVAGLHALWQCCQQDTGGLG